MRGLWRSKQDIPLINLKSISLINNYLSIQNIIVNSTLFFHKINIHVIVLEYHFLK